MPHNKSQLLMILIFLFLFWLNACENKSGLKVAKTETPYPPTVESTSTVTPVPSAIWPTIPDVFPVATVSKIQEFNLFETLHSEYCELPCYMGITPGKTTWAEAEKILFTLGIHYQDEGPDEAGWHGYSYRQVVSGTVSSERMSTPDGKPRQPLRIYQNLGFTVGDSVVQRIWVSISTFDQAPKLDKYWSRYSPPQIFSRLGNPDGVYFAASSRDYDGSGMMFVYESLGIVMEFRGIREGGPICPNFENEGYSSRDFILTYPESSRLSLFPSGDKNVPTDHDMWLPVSEIFGISQEEFYTRLVSNPSVCFDIKY